MKATIPVTLILLFASELLAQGGEIPVSVAIQAQQATIKLGAEVPVKIQMTNSSDSIVSCGKLRSDGLDKAYTYEMWDTKGQPTSKVVKEHPELGGDFSVSAPCQLQPGEATEPEDVIINRFYDMTRPGDYVMQVTRSVTASGKTYLIKSNKLRITIVP